MRVAAVTKDTNKLKAQVLASFRAVLDVWS
jgi:hypothetical protein